MNNSRLCEMAKKHENRGEVETAYQLYLEAALAEEDGEAMYALAQMYFEGDYVHKNYDKAGRYFGMACDLNANIEPWTLIIAGSYWEKRADEKEENLLYAIRYYELAALLGIEYGYECLGEIYFELGDYEKAYENLLNMEGRNPCGLYYMGRLYEEGYVVDRDPDKAVEFYKKTIEIGSQNDDYGEDDHCMRAKKRLRVMGRL